MGLLNRFFGNKVSTAKEIIKDEEKQKKLWKKHLDITKDIQILSGHFSFGTYFDKALQDFEQLKTILTKMKTLITTELVTLDLEEELEREIIKDVQSFHDTRYTMDYLTKNLIKKQSTEIFHELFMNLCENWVAAIQLIDKLCAMNITGNDTVKIEKQKQARELLKQLNWRLRIIDDLTSPFDEEQPTNKKKYLAIMEFARKILFDKEIKEELKTEVESDEEKFAEDMATKMGDAESRGGYRTLGKNIYLQLAEQAGAPAKNILKAMEKMEKIMEDDNMMMEIVKKLRPKLTDDKLKIIILAFRKAYDFGHFDDLASTFAT